MATKPKRTNQATATSTNREKPACSSRVPRGWTPLAWISYCELRAERCAEVRPDQSDEWLDRAEKAKEEARTVIGRPDKLPPVDGWILKCASGQVRGRLMTREEVLEARDRGIRGTE